MSALPSPSKSAGTGVSLPMPQRQAVVRQNGHAVSRLRAVWRGLVTWAWVVVAVWLAYPAFTPGFVVRLLLAMHVSAGIRIALAIGAAVIFLTGAMAAAGIVSDRFQVELVLQPPHGEVFSKRIPKDVGFFLVIGAR
jgi:hypothetical protein